MVCCEFSSLIVATVGEQDTTSRDGWTSNLATLVGGVPRAIEIAPVPSCDWKIPDRQACSLKNIFD